MAKVTSRYLPTLKDFASGVPSQDPDDEQVVLLKGLAWSILKFNVGYRF